MKNICIALLFLSCGCCSYKTVKSSVNNMPVIGSITHGSFSLMSDVYEGTETLLGVPYEFIKSTVVTLGLEAYIHTLPLEKEVKNRIVLQLRNPKYSGELLAFVLFLKKQYTPQNKVQRFSEYAKQHNFSSMLGSVSLNEENADKTEQSKESKKSITQRELIAKGLEIYDSIFLQGKSIIKEKPQATYSYLTIKNEKLITRTQGFVVELLTKVAKSMEEGEYKTLVENILSHEDKREALTISIIDFVRMTILKNYRMFAQKYHRRENLKKWFIYACKEEMQSQKDGTLIEFLQNENNNKRYSVHVVVDGLQGLLMKSLSGQKSSQNLFIKSLDELHDNYTSRRSSKENLQQITTPQKFDFLQHIAQNDFDNPHYLPFFRSLYQKYKNSISRQGLAATPTISVRNLPIVKTGAGVAGKGATGIPNFHFVDRKIDRGYYFYGNDALLLEKIARDNGMKTMFQRLSSLNNISYYGQYDWWAQTSYDSFLNLAKGEGDRDFGEVLLIDDLQQRAATERKLRKLRLEAIAKIRNLKKQWSVNVLKQYALDSDIDRILKEIAENNDKGMPEYVLYYNPWPDHFAHFVGPFSDDMLSMTGELNRLDYWLNKVTQIYKDMGIYDRTLFAMAGDHGLTPVFYYLNPEKEVFEKLSSELQTPILIKKLSSDEGEGPKLNHNISPSSNKGFDVVLASTAGGNFMIDLFKSQGDDWQQQPLYQELQKWKTLSGVEVDITSEIVSRLPETLDYLVVREQKCDLKQAYIRLSAQRKGKRIDEWVMRHGNKIYYQFSDANLLEVEKMNTLISFSEQQKNRYRELWQKCCKKAQKNNRETWATESEWRELTSYTNKPDSVVQISHLYDIDIAGTINLFPREGIGYNTKVPGRHAGDHFHEKDAFVGFWGGAITNAKPLPSLPGGALSPTIYEFLTNTKATKGNNGWGFDSVWSSLHKNKEVK